MRTDKKYINLEAKCKEYADEARRQMNHVAAVMQERDALAERVREMRDALEFYGDQSRYLGPNRPLDDNDTYSTQAGFKAYRLDVTRDGGVIAQKALATPDDSAAILARLKADIWREAAKVCVGMIDISKWVSLEAGNECAEALRAKAESLEKEHGNG